MATYKTPDVYVEEISTLPPSVAEVSTAVPAFIGYTEKASKGGQSLTNVPTRINTMLDYEQHFGGPSKMEFDCSVDGDSNITSIAPNGDLKYMMYYNIDMYFKNGGGTCYIISVGDYKGEPDAADYQNGMAALEKEDEPTLIVFTEATTLAKDKYYGICQDALSQCGKLKDRFTIMDVLEDDADGSDFRGSMASDYLKYGAAYYPYLTTTLSYAYDESGVKVSGVSSVALKTWVSGDNGAKVTYSGNAEDPRVKIFKTNKDQASGIEWSIDGNDLVIRGVADGTTGTEISDSFRDWTGQKAGFSVEVNGDGSAAVATTGTGGEALTEPGGDSADYTLETLKSNSTGLYNQIKSEIGKFRVKLPPSGCMAGVYARVDRDRGVWKAPANVSVSNVIGPTVKITNEDQEGLNVDPQAGKSINAIRAFAGKGTLVWGARTLAGNDNEWRYVPVRRLFNLIEESCKKSTAFAVFEPNDATTWLKVQGMIDSYLYGLWQQGALAGSSQKAAYFVNVGLGKTMTEQDILEGRMIVEVGIAAVRPAEFIILRFSHKLQEA